MNLLMEPVLDMNERVRGCGGFGMGSASKALAMESSQFSLLEIRENACGDRALFLGGVSQAADGDSERSVFGDAITETEIEPIIQSHTADEHMYHEALVHPALVLFATMHGRSPKYVFLGGSGEGAGAREILRWRGVQAVTMCELDAHVVQMSRTWLPGMATGLNDERLTLIVDNVTACLKTMPDGFPRFDVAIFDFPDLFDGPFEQLYTSEFYRMLKPRLTPRGVLATQAGPAAVGGEPGLDLMPDYAETVQLAMRSAGFAAATILAHPMPTWTGSTVPEGSVAWSCVALATDAQSVAGEAATERAAAAETETLGSIPSLAVETVDWWLADQLEGRPLRFYSGVVHRAMAAMGMGRGSARDDCRERLAEVPQHGRALDRTKEEL